MRTPETLTLGPQFTLPLDAVTETFAILAKRRAGKSNAAVVMAEEMFRAGLPWVAVDPKGDWWGVRAGREGDGPGLAVIVFGGLHGDVPLEPTSGRLVADLVADRRLTCVLDVSEMSKADRRRFLADFAEQLYRVNRLPLHIFAEEADEYIPQRVTAGDARMVDAWESLVKRGGFRGIGMTIISQRSASVNKDILSQVETLIAMRTPSPQDRKAILGWVDQHADGADVVAELPSLESGEAWVFSPQWLGSLTKIKFRRRSTFDSGSTPTVGATPALPATLAPVDLAEITTAMADTIERHHGDDPTVLHTRIRALEARLAAAATATSSAPVPAIVQRVEVPVLTPETLTALANTTGRLQEAYTEQAQRLQDASRETDAVLAALREAHIAITAAAASAPVVVDQAEVTHLPAPRTARQRPAPAGPGRVAGSQSVPLRAGARRMVEALGRMAPLRLTRAQWATVAGLKPTSGTWSTYLSDLRRSSLLDESSAGFTLSDKGFSEFGGTLEPMTAVELQDHYRRILRAGAAKMLDVLIATYPAVIDRDRLADTAGLSARSGTFSTYLSELIRNGLAARIDGGLLATEVLMRGADMHASE